MLRVEGFIFDTVITARKPLNHLKWIPTELRLWRYWALKSGFCTYHTGEWVTTVLEHVVCADVMEDNGKRILRGNMVGLSKIRRALSKTDCSLIETDSNLREPGFGPGKAREILKSGFSGLQGYQH